jgi:NADH-quinone oxidoreductase subunit G
VEYNYESQKENIEEAIKDLKDTDSIVFSADITNEEALVFQSLKEKHGKRLICPEAKAYQDFLKAYSSSSGYHLFKGDSDVLSTSEVVISFGVWFQDESTESTALVRKMLDEKKTKFVYMHPIEDATLQTSITQFIKYEVGSEEGVAALLAHTLLEDKELPKEIEDILEDLDIGYLSAESNVGEEELESMYGLINRESTTSLIVGSDVYTHPKAEQIAKLIALLEQYAGVNILCLPPAQNALGVALICELDDVAQGRSVSYKSCKEGTYVNVDKCVYIYDDMQPSDIDRLNSIANALGLHAKNLIDYSDRLPQDKGFKILSHDDLKKPCLYRLMPQEQIREFTLDEIDDLPVYDGAVIYTYKVEKPIAEERGIEDVLSGSKQFAMATKLQDGDVISFEIEGVNFVRVFKIDTYMKGVVALNPTFDIKLSASLLSSYRFSRLAFEKINNQKIGNNDE